MGASNQLLRTGQEHWEWLGQGEIEVGSKEALPYAGGGTIGSGAAPSLGSGPVG